MIIGKGYKARQYSIKNLAKHSKHVTNKDKSRQTDRPSYLLVNVLSFSFAHEKTLKPGDVFTRDSSKIVPSYLFSCGEEEG